MRMTVVEVRAETMTVRNAAGEGEVVVMRVEVRARAASGSEMTWRNDIRDIPRVGDVVSSTDGQVIESA